MKSTRLKRTTIAKDEVTSRLHRRAGSKRRQHAKGAAALRNQGRRVVQRGRDVCASCIRCARASSPAPASTANGFSAAILFEDTMDRDIEGQPTADYLWNVKRVVPFLKVDKGLAAEKDGVQLMKPMPELAALLDKAKAKRIFGTKMRSVIKQANAAGIKDIVNQQFELAAQIHRRRSRADRRAGSRYSLPGKGQGRSVAQGGHSREAQQTAGGSVGHAQAHAAGARRLLCGFRQTSQGSESGCASGGYSREEANDRLRRNHGVVASFSRALVEGLSAQQSDAEFNAMLDAAIQSIFEASNT